MLLSTDLIHFTCRYQFQPGRINTAVALQLLLKALTNLPKTDFIMLKSVLPQDLVSLVIILYTLNPVFENRWRGKSQVYTYNYIKVMCWEWRGQQSAVDFVHAYIHTYIHVCKQRRAWIGAILHQTSYTFCLKVAISTTEKLQYILFLLAFLSVFLTYPLWCIIIAKR